MTWHAAALSQWQRRISTGDRPPDDVLRQLGSTVGAWEQYRGGDLRGLVVVLPRFVEAPPPGTRLCECRFHEFLVTADLAGPQTARERRGQHGISLLGDPGACAIPGCNKRFPE